MSALQSALAELRSAATTSTLPHLPTPQSAALLEHIDQLTGRRDQLASALSDQQLDEIEEFLDVWDAAPAHRTRYRDVISSQKSGEDGRKLRASTLRGLLAEIRRLRGERGDLTEKVDAATKTAVRLAEQRDQMGELVQAARSERERYTAQNQRLRGELDDAAGYLAATHRHANRHDVLGKDLGCAGCALLGRIEGTTAEPDRVPLRTPTPGRSDAHFSPGYSGEIPDHHGVFAACAMPACVTSRAQHEAAADIQDLTAALFDENGGEP